ncbi:MAG TPA: hypothetical protein DD381_06945 [Lentisphaeria bacterium]|nr:MAG: hypothetical protein A2X47_05440 [Lentisphaerae bacterium GWF2_38_69]HBM16060.1 hypothetical protein [Lentisphaeria bacterium]
MSNIYKLVHGIYGYELNVVKFSYKSEDTAGLTSLYKDKRYEVWHSNNSTYVTCSSTEGLPLLSISELAFKNNLNTVAPVGKDLHRL